MDTFCQSPVTTNTQRNIANIPNERQITSDILTEMLKGFTLHSTINDSEYYNLDTDDTKSNPKSDPLVSTHTSDSKKIKVTDTDTTSRNYPQKSLINRIIPVIILTINLLVAYEVADGKGNFMCARRLLQR